MRKGDEIWMPLCLKSITRLGFGCRLVDGEVMMTKEDSDTSSVGEGTQDSGIPDEMPPDEAPCTDRMRMMRLGTPCPTKKPKRGTLSFPCI